ncbi:hypothetical protein N7E81_10110 [Reichenbachiella carrageenanivorans]|uniref:Uncharacterized protein n=1 Tax=Reichenbachiella carrageenanivorans TaxID=2979869 RepID=A0ABY6CUX8_9BACT|nr:hypothetical protein [Reichenbachiella carrageenanivorans]UXX77722.1 hypothetical protein N7E81_10110 [Reichenbachiella carrageenanivorans]
MSHKITTCHSTGMSLKRPTNTTYKPDHTMRNICLSFLMVAAIFTSCTIDEPSIDNTDEFFQKFVGGASREELSTVHALSDGGQIVLATKNPNNTLTSSYFLFRTDAYGNTDWFREIGTNHAAVASDMIVQDQSIIIAGHMTTSNGDQDLVLWKTDLEGNDIDSLSLGIAGANEVLPKIMRLEEGVGYVVAAQISNGNDITDNIVYLLDANDYSTIWKTSYGLLSTNANVVGLAQVATDRILWVGSQNSSTETETSVSLNVLNTSGLKVSTTQIGLNNNKQDKAYTLSSDFGSYLISGSTTANGETSGMLVQFSYRNGVQINNLLTNERSSSYELFHAISSPTGGYYVTGYQSTGPENKDIYLSKWSREGAIDWETSFGGNGDDIGHVISITAQDHLLVHGTANVVTNQSITILQTTDKGKMFE